MTDADIDQLVSVVALGMQLRTSAFEVKRLQCRYQISMAEINPFQWIIFSDTRAPHYWFTTEQAWESQAVKSFFARLGIDPIVLRYENTLSSPYESAWDHVIRAEMTEHYINNLRGRK
jgi:hypothetical protein